MRTLQAFSAERMTVGASARRSRMLFGAAQALDRRARLPHRRRHLPRSSPASSACCGSARRTCWRAACRPARSANSCSTRCSRASALGELSEVWGELSDGGRRGRAARRNLHGRAVDRRAGEARMRCRADARARSRSRESRSPIRRDATHLGAAWTFASGGARRDGRDRRPVGRRQVDGLLAASCASTIPMPARVRSTASIFATRRSASRRARVSRSCRRSRDHLRRHDRRQHPLRPPRGERRRRSRSAAKRRTRRRVHPRACRRATTRWSASAA